MIVIQIEDNEEQSSNNSSQNKSESGDNNQSDEQDQDKVESDLQNIADALAAMGEMNSDADAHNASQNQSDIDKEIAQSQLSNAIKNSEDATGSKPGMRGEDYKRALNPSTKAKKLPKLSIKLTKIKKFFDSSTHVNWSMPHQILTKRLDLHRIEKDPRRPHIDVWLDTSGSMSEDELNRLMGLVIVNYVTSAKKTPIIIHPVSFGEVGEPIKLTSTKDVEKLKNVGIASNGGTSFEDVLAKLEPGSHIIMSDFEWNTGDVTNNMAVLRNPDKNIMWINTSENSYNSDVLDAIRSTKQILINVRDYEY